MPDGARFGADNASNFTNGRRKPTKPFVKAMCAALGVEEDAIMPPFLLDRVGSPPEVSPLVSQVPGKPDRYRFFLDREMTLKQALKMAEALEEVENAS